MLEGRARVSLGDVAHVIAALLLGVSGALAVCAFVGLLLRDGSFLPLISSAAIVFAFSLAGRIFTRVPEDLNHREGFLTVTLAWTAISVAGAIPFVLSGAIPSPVDALFESVSGFTTTGSTVLTDIEALPRGILLWRSLTQWMGGMGIIVLGIAVLPYLGVGGMQLFRAEVPGPTKDRLRPRISETAKVLWIVYTGFTAAAVVAYMVCGMSLFDAVNHALTTLPTGGFSTRNASMAAFSPAAQWVAIFFMYVAGINFTLHFRSITRINFRYWRDDEWRFYTGVAIVAGALVWGSLLAGGGALGISLRAGVFQAVSILTTTGYGTADYVQWSSFAQIVLFLLFFVGGMAGSTAGGPKAVRVLLILKHGFGEMRKYLHPRAIMVTKLSRVPVLPQVMLNVFAFMILYVGLFGIGTGLMATTGISLAGAAGAAATAISNVGPALQELGPVQNFSLLPAYGKIVLAVLMLVGRLEIYTVLLLFHPGLWRR